MPMHGIEFIVDPPHQKKRLDYEIAKARKRSEEYSSKWNIQCQANILILRETKN